MSFGYYESEYLQRKRDGMVGVGDQVEQILVTVDKVFKDCSTNKNYSWILNI